MKKSSFLLVLFMISTSVLWAQTTRTIRVKAGEDIAQAYSSNGFYLFPKFTKAIFYYKGGAQNSSSQVNYNLLSRNIQFIGPKKDTLDLAGQENIDSIAFDNMLLYNDEGLMEVVRRSDSALLLKRITLKTDFENIGAYGQPNATGSIENMRNYLAPSGVFNLVLNQDVVVAEKITWHFMGKNKKLLKATRSNLYKVLSPKGIRKAEAHFNKNDTDFGKEADLVSLMDAIAK